MSTAHNGHPVILKPDVETIKQTAKSFTVQDVMHWLQRAESPLDNYTKLLVQYEMKAYCQARDINFPQRAR